jgi:hypothetical protein
MALPENLEAVRSHFATTNPVVEDRLFPLNDSLFARYLRARTTVKAAIDAIVKTILWRNEFKIKEMQTEWKDVLMNENSTGKMYIRGFTKSGNAILYMRPKYENTKDHNGNMKHLVYHMERAIAIMNKQEKGVEKIVLLIDYDGFSIFNAPPMKTSMETLSILQNHYPERLARAYCIKPPFIFNMFWKAIYPFIDPVTKDKIVMVHDNKILTETIDPAVLEKSLGGDDERLFESNKWLNSSFEDDYYTILNKSI